MNMSNIDIISSKNFINVYDSEIGDGYLQDTYGMEFYHKDYLWSLNYFDHDRRHKIV